MLPSGGGGERNHLSEGAGPDKSSIGSSWGQFRDGGAEVGEGEGGGEAGKGGEGDRSVGRERGFGEDVELPLIGIAVVGGGIGAGVPGEDEEVGVAAALALELLISS